MMRVPYHKIQKLIKVRLDSSSIQGELYTLAYTKYLRSQNQLLSMLFPPFE